MQFNRFKSILESHFLILLKLCQKQRGEEEEEFNKL